jgi:hypothetical protein
MLGETASQSNSCICIELCLDLQMSFGCEFSVQFAS